MQKNFRKIAKIALILVYLVIVAGAVVRMTGSGMGCPDWPKCFGYYIPPTHIAQLQWQPHKAYKSGQVIIVSEALRVASRDFTSATQYDEANWGAYDKHDYAVFNAKHTWTEFINRLMGALAGLATLFLALMSFGYWKKKKVITLLSWLLVLAMGFQAWLGATVVFSVLAPVKISIHMIMALAIVGLLLYLLHSTQRELSKNAYDRTSTRLFGLALVLTLVQIALGTQVRQFIDEQIDLLGAGSKALWLSKPEWNFYIHRSFSIVVLLINGILAWRIYKLGLGYPKMIWVLLLLGIEVLSGILMNYAAFPFGSQPLHLVLASLLFGLQFYLVLEGRDAAKSAKTL